MNENGEAQIFSIRADHSISLTGLLSKRKSLIKKRLIILTLPLFFRWILLLRLNNSNQLAYATSITKLFQRYWLID